MDYLAERKLIDASSRNDLLVNKLVLVAPANSNVALTIGKDFPLAQSLGNGRLPMGDPAAAAGKYGKAALENLGKWASVAGKIAPAQDVRAALSLVSRDEAPLGIVYHTDAVADKSVKIVGTFPEASHPKIIYPVAVTGRSTNIVTPVFVQFLFSNKASPYFEKYFFVFDNDLSAIISTFDIEWHNFIGQSRRVAYRQENNHANRRDKAKAWGGFGFARNVCMTCHEAEKVGFIDKQPLFSDTEPPSSR